MKWPFLKKNIKRLLPLTVFLTVMYCIQYFQSPFLFIYKVSEGAQQIISKFDEYYVSKEILKQENRKLLDEVLKLKKENIELQILSGESTKIAETLHSLRTRNNLIGLGVIVSSSFNSDTRLVILSDVLLKPDQLLLSNDALVGRVVEAHDGFAYVMLTTDVHYGVPIITARSRDKGIANGIGNGKIKISFINNKPDILVGDLIISSGDGLIHPYGIPVGVITEMQGSVIKATPLYKSLDIVSIHSK